MIKIITYSLNKLLSETKELTLIGYYGRNNFGDDLMLKSIVTILNKYDLKINILSFEEIPWINDSANVVVWANLKVEKYKNFKKAIDKSSLVIFGGGTCFTDEDGDGFFKYMAYAKLKGKKIGYIGVGIGNLKRSSRKLKAMVLINLSDYLSFRDKYSYDLAWLWRKRSKNEIELIDDPANKLLEKITQPTENNTDSGLVIAWRNLERYYKTTIGNDMNKVISLSLDLCRKYNLHKISIIDADSYFDNEVNQKLFTSLKKQNNLEIYYLESKLYKDKLKVLQNSKVILTSRLHIAISAEYMGKTCYVYNYSPKIEYYTNSINSEEIICFSEFNLM